MNEIRTELINLIEQEERINSQYLELSHKAERNGNRSVARLLQSIADDEEKHASYIRELLELNREL